MIWKNFKKAVVMGLGMALLSSGIVFAQQSTDQKAGVKTEIAADEPVFMTLMDNGDKAAPDEGVSIANSGFGETAEAGGGMDGAAASDETASPVEEAILYTTVADKELDADAADSAAASDPASKNEMSDPDRSVSSDDLLTIQITSTDAEANAEETELLRKLAAESAPVTVGGTELKNADTSLWILVIAGTAAVIGGAVLTSKRKNSK